MPTSYWLINSKRTEVKRFIKNDKSVDGVFEYMFVDTGKIVGVLGKEPPVMTTTVSVDIDLAREIYGTVGDSVNEAMNGPGVLHKIFKKIRI